MTLKKESENTLKTNEILLSGQHVLLKRHGTLNMNYWSRILLLHPGRLPPTLLIGVAIIFEFKPDVHDARRHIKPGVVSS